MQQVGPLEIHIARSFTVDAVGADDGFVVLNAAPRADDILRPGVFTVQRLDKQALRVRRKAFVNPHVGDVFVGNVVGEPLVARLMHDDEVERQAPARARQVVTQIAIAEAVAVGN